LTDDARVKSGMRRRAWLALAMVGGLSAAGDDARAVPVIVPEKAIAAPQYGPTYGSASWPSIACNADGCLAAWREGRQGLGYRVWARRLRADGTPRDPAAFLVSVDDFSATEPVVATDGTRFLVGWSDTFTRMFLTRVDADDSLHTESTPLRNDDFDPVHPAAIAFDGDGYLLVYVYPVATPTGTIVALRADRDGHILSALPIVISTDPQARGIADVIWTGTQYLVVWNQGANNDGAAYGARVTGDGTVLDPSGFFIATLAGGFSSRPQLALGGGKLLLVAGREGGSSGGGPDAVLLDTDGRNPSRVALPTWSELTDGLTADAAWNGSAFVMMWVGSPIGQQLHAVRIPPTGTITDTTPITLAFGGAEWPAVAVSGPITFVAYTDRSAGRVRLANLNPTTGIGFPTDPPLNTSSVQQRLLAAARGAGHTLVVWADDVQGTRASALLAARVADDGTVLDATPIVLSAAGPDKGRASAAAAWGGGQYLVAWWEQTDIVDGRVQTVRVSAGGVADTSPTVLASNLFSNRLTAIASSGSNFLVTWREPGIISIPPPLNAALIGADGKAIGSAFSVGPGDASAPWGVATAQGGGYLVGWNRFTPGMYGVHLQHIDAAGAQSVPVRVTEDQAGGSLSLVTVPGRVLVWMNGGSGLLVSPAPSFIALAGTSPINLARNIGAPSWNGFNFVSATVNTRGIYDFDSQGVDVTLMSTDGVVVEPSTTIVEPRNLTALPPIAVGLDGSKNLVAYSRLVPEHDHGTLRVRFQIVGGTQPITPDAGAPADGGEPGDGGATGDAPVTTDGPPTADAPVAADAATDGAGDAGDATPEAAPPAPEARDAADEPGVVGDGAAPDVVADAAAPVDASVDTGALDAGRPDVTGSSDAASDAKGDTASGCSCALSPTKGAPLEPLGVLLLALAACFARRRR
jgi:MYXO-CTERM domain-containing protein